MAAWSLCGCAGAAKRRSSTSEVPSYVSAPFTHEQLLVERGAHLFVSDGCSACHAISGKSAEGPSFGELAGNHVTLDGGARVLVDERFLRRALLDPRATELRGYPPAAMIAAVRRLHLRLHPADVTAIAAFIEQIGPENG
jgi:mono/diheme cytochrome c family protein